MSCQKLRRGAPRGNSFRDLASKYIVTINQIAICYTHARKGLRMSRLQTIPISVCPIANAARLLGDRWTLVILRDLAEQGPLRFSEIQDTSEGISPRTLADRLRHMEDAGLVNRESFREIPPRVQY